MNSSIAKIAVLIGSLMLLLVSGTAWWVLGQVGLMTRNGLAVPQTLAVIFSNAAAVVLAPLLLFAAYFLREKEYSNATPATVKMDSGLAGVAANVLALLIGTAIGWALAVFWVPFDDEDGAIYSKIGAGVTAFLSGIVVSYVQPLVQEERERNPRALVVKASLGMVALSLTALAVIINRTEYLQFARWERSAELALKAREKATTEAVRARYSQAYAAIQAEKIAQRDARFASLQLDRLRGDCGKGACEADLTRAEELKVQAMQAFARASDAAASSVKAALNDRGAECVAPATVIASAQKPGTPEAGADSK